MDQMYKGKMKKKKDMFPNMPGAAITAATAGRCLIPEV